MKVLHVFNSSVLSGPEKLIIENYAVQEDKPVLLFLQEDRLSSKGMKPWEYASSLGFVVKQIHVRSRIDNYALKELQSYIEEVRPANIHAHDVKASSYVLWAVRTSDTLRKKTYLLSTHHGVRGRKGIRARLYESWYVKTILPKYDKVLSVCDSDANILRARGLREDVVSSLPNGIPLPNAYPEKKAREMLNELSAIKKYENFVDPVSTRHFFYIGRLEAEKGIIEVLDFFANMQKIAIGAPSPHNDFLTYFGVGSEQQRLEALVKSYAIEQRVAFAGFRSDASRLLSAASAVLLLSPAEGLPITLLEAAALGVPVCARAVDGINELMPSEDYGTLWDGKENLQNLAERFLHRLQSGEAIKAALRLKERYESSFTSELWLKNLNKYYC